MNLHVLCRCVNHIDYDDYIMFVWMIDASIWDYKLYFINSHEGVISMFVLGLGSESCCALWII